MESHSQDFQNFLRHCSLTDEQIHLVLGSANSDEKRRIALSLRDQATQERLYSLASLSTQKYTLDDFCPQGEVVTFDGRNSMPAFSRFQKKFFHPPGEDRIWGYNHQLANIVTGPGYFCVSQFQGKLVFDYTVIPPMQPKGFPKVVPNEFGIGKLVYGGLKDIAVPITKDWWVARAMKQGKLICYFMLVR